MPTYNMLQAKSNLSRLVDAVESGAETEIVIARNGKPAARLVPIDQPVDTSRRLGLLEGIYDGPSSQEAFDADNKMIEALFYGKEE